MHRAADLVVGRLLRRLDAFWFAEGLAARLALLRIAVGGGTLFYFAVRYSIFTGIARSAPTVFEPVGLSRLLGSPISPSLFDVLLWATILTNVAFVLGWRFRVTGPLFAALFLWVLCYRNSWSMIYHSDNLVALHVLILGLTRSADALSLDALRWQMVRGWWSRLRGSAVASPALVSDPGWLPASHWEYGYPVRLMCAVAAVTYVLSGIAKVAGPLGWGWALGEGLRTQIAFDGLRKELIANGAQPLAFILYNDVALASIIGAGTLALELGAVVAVFFPRLGVVWAVLTFGMHWGIYLIMGIVFWYHLSGLAFLPFLLGNRLVAWGLGWLGHAASALALMLAPRRSAPGPIADPG